VLCHDPTYPVYEKQTFAYDGWRVIQEHKKAAYGTGIPMATAIPVARQFAYGNYLDEALTVDADTDSDGDCIDSGGSTRYYYHQNSLFSVVALSDASANYKEGYQYDPYGRHVRITDGNDGDTYVNFNTNDARSALATSAYGNPYLFTGQRLDSESGLYYYKMRYYSTSQGRFISRDPIGYREGVSLYQYVGGKPLSRVDPRGLIKSATQEEEDWVDTEVTVSVAFDPGVGPGGYVPSPISGTGPGGLPTIDVKYTVKALVYKACINDGKIPVIEVRKLKLGYNWNTLVDLPLLFMPWFHVDVQKEGNPRQSIQTKKKNEAEETATLTHEQDFWLGIEIGLSFDLPIPFVEGSDLTIRAVTRDVDPHTLTFTKSCTYWCGWSVGTQGGK
jgi:RHS repeat-associated protein